jgi:LysM repeat protein/ABC-type branched-subunit amino acid transport system substrate-binding protein
MKIFKYVLVLLFIVSFSSGVDAQLLKENEIVVIQGQKFVIHQVRTGETVFSISRQYEIDSQTLAEHNPKINEGLKVGEMLRIPYKEGVNWQQPTVQPKGDPVSFEMYTISSRTETPYFIAREFGITVEDIYAYNPEVSHFRKGTRIRIPRWDDTQTTGRSTVGMDEGLLNREMITHEVQRGESLKSIARRFNISEDDILFYNPGARELTAGVFLQLPVAVDDEMRELREPVDAASATAGSFFDHTIVSGETMWSLTRKYNVTEAQLKKFNPILQNSFPAGVTIKVPVTARELVTAEPVHEEAFNRHVVKAGETLFGLASRYNVSIPDIRQFNPQLEKRNLVYGETILIPRKAEKELARTEQPLKEDSLRLALPEYQGRYYEIEIPAIVPENCRPANSFTSGRPYEVALFLPLFVYSNDTLNKRAVKKEAPSGITVPDNFIDGETVVEMDEPEEMFYGFFRESENYLKFYEGVLLAVDSLQRSGMRIVLNVFDTQQNADSIRKFIYAESFLETDLIIGPVFPNVQKEVAAIAAKNRIPIISPLSAQSNDLTSNQYYFQVNPSRDFLIAKTAELISEEYYNGNFVVIGTSRSGNIPEAKVVDMVREKLSPSGYWNSPRGLQFNSYNFSSQGPGGLSRVLSRDRENVIFVSSLNEGDLSVVLSNINNLARTYPVTLIGFNRYEQFTSIQEDFFHNLKLHYVAPYWADYTHPETIRFIKKFRQHFHTDPGNYGMQGYDVAFYFLSALKNYGKDFKDCLPYHQVHLAQGSYRFEKQSQFGGFMNEGVSIISYERNYDVIRKRVVGPYRFAQRQ